MARRGIRTTVALLTAVLSLLLPATQGTAAADVGGIVLAVTASGTLSPGLVIGACIPQFVTFDGTAVAAGTKTGTRDIHFRGSSNGCETVASGQGSGTVSGGVQGSISYTRTANQVTLSGSLSIDGDTARAIVVGLCLVAAASNPVVSITLLCVVLF